MPIPDGLSVLRVGDAIRILRTVIQSDTRLQNLWVKGELRGLKRAPSGHTYFSVADALGQLDCVVFSGDAPSAFAVEPQDGMGVLAHGRITIYDAKSRYQLVVDRLEPAGVGLMAQQLEALRRRLAGEGLFSAQLKRRLPFLPRRVAVVTSSRGAAVRDVIKVLGRRCPAVDVVVIPTTVEGDRAPLEIVSGLLQARRLEGIELIMLVRGGGAAEDLWPFNTEEVVRAIRNSPIPVLTGIGHEVDQTLADQAADHSASTPSAAAEIAAPDARELLRAVLEARHRLDHGVKRELQVKALELRTAQANLQVRGPRHLLDSTRQTLDQRFEDLARGLASNLSRARAGLVRGLEQLESAGPRRRVLEQQRELVRQRAQLNAEVARLTRSLRVGLEGRRSQLQALSPLAVLARGYTLTLASATGLVVTSASEARRAGGLETVFSDGRVRSRLEEETTQ